ncbi:hypothetical protein A3F29_03745 [Candidatus Roizmanbacteria bacterium RIFCSPHIGHO2_12_FULL_33_9]|uniref:SpoVT-AbrB domain-containing protein n=1 Tax=Candidatus Roizmanbacteria bacterium RIFCSPHIGHO2_12_FULL_33_9 TaxID=1802045 RepID=A0A1F7HIM6_9BACT|nr:MAG: hypothetical protein A3F29_03745 [Candidatus Roizmanbacteria bacterium RIFCSPHIGHO2_12_FULL_33_9]
MINIQGTAIIRNRGQLTIPEKVREALDWAKPSAVVSITTSKDEIIIKPYAEKVDWDQIEKDIRKLRAYKGVQGSMSEFIAEDRYRH